MRARDGTSTSNPEREYRVAHGSTGNPTAATSTLPSSAPSAIEQETRRAGNTASAISRATQAVAAIIGSMISNPRGVDQHIDMKPMGEPEEHQEDGSSQSACNKQLFNTRASSSSHSFLVGTRFRGRIVYRVQPGPEYTHSFGGTHLNMQSRPG